MFTPEQLEKMRAIGLRLDRAGTFWHEGTTVSHPRLRQALLRWLDVREDGRDIVRFASPGPAGARSTASGSAESIDDKRYAYVDVEDAHLRALSARWDGDRVLVLWDDDQEEELDYASLSQSEDHAFYANAHGRLRGRIAGPAHHAIAERVIESGDGFALPAAGSQWPIANAA
jgi:hypothetical protein